MVNSGGQRYVLKAWCTCRAVVLLIEPIIFWRCPCRCRRGCSSSLLMRKINSWTWADYSSLIFSLQRVVIQRVLPQLCAEFSNHQMVPFVLPNVLLIAEDCTTQEFSDLILPELKPVFKIQEPIQVGVQSVLAIKLSVHSDHLKNRWTVKALRVMSIEFPLVILEPY